MVKFWDSDNGDWWSWDYDPAHLDSLTVRERGATR